MIAVVGAVERPASHTDVSAAVGALADDRSHIYRTVIRQFKYGREGLAFLGGKAVQQDTAFLQQLRHFPVTHLAVADDAVDVEHAGRIVADVMLTAVALAGLHYTAAAQGAAAYDFLFCFHFLIYLLLRCSYSLFPYHLSR